MHTLTFLTPSTLVEALSDALMFELEALSVGLEDADVGTEDEQALFAEPGLAVEAAWPRSNVVAMFATEDAAHHAADELMGRPWADDITMIGLAAVPDTDWVRATQSQFTPVAITPDFWIVPSWHEAPAQATRVIRLDPGLAFGSGTHPTTRMCLRWIARHAADDIAGRRVIDYGCGSGILAIAAVMHGARQVDATDVDESALAATRENAHANRVALGIGAPDVFTGTYDVVVANILATPLRLLSPVLTARLERGGHLVMAGLLSRQAEMLCATYAPTVDLHVEDEDEGWVLLSGRSKRGPVASSFA